MSMTSARAPRSASVGEMLRGWRERRRLSQLELSNRAEVSTRHLSFVETGRSRPTPEMILRLSDQLEVPLRERNELLLAGGFAPAYPAHRLDEPELAAVLSALRAVLDGHDPYPALVLDRWWDVVDANRTAQTLIELAATHLQEPPVNVLRLTLHPDGLAPYVANLGEWRAHLLHQLARRAEHLDDDRLRAMDDELRGYAGTSSALSPSGVVVPMRLRLPQGELAMFSLATNVQTAADVTVEELSVESFYPADAASERLLRDVASSRPS